MDNTLICTVNKNLEMAMAKYSSITGQLAEMKKKILGAERNITDSSADIEESPSASQKESALVTSEENNFLDSTSITNSEEKSSLFLNSSQESFEQFSDYNRPAVQVEDKIDTSNLTLSTTIKESDSAEENIFNDIFKHFKTKSNASSSKRSSSPPSSDSDDEEASSNSYSEDDKTIENLFLEEISKVDKNEFSMEVNKEENVAEEEKSIWNESSEKSSVNDIHIPYENIISKGPIDIGIVLEDKTILQGSKKIVSGKTSEVYENDDILSIKTKLSQKSSFLKKKTLEKKNVLKRKSNESNVNSITTEIKSIRRTKSIKSVKAESIKRPPLKNSLKMRKEKSSLPKRTEKENIKNSINKELGNKRNDKNTFKMISLKKAGEIINPLQQSHNNKFHKTNINSINVKNNIKQPMLKRRKSFENKIHPKHFLKPQEKEINSIVKVNNNMPLLGSHKKKLNALIEKRSSLEITKNTSKQISLPNSSKLLNHLSLSKSDLKDDLQNNTINFNEEENNTESGIEVVVPNPKDILLKIEEEIRATKLNDSKKETSKLEMLESSHELNKLNFKNDLKREFSKEKSKPKNNNSGIRLSKTNKLFSEKNKLTNSINFKQKEESFISFPQEMESPSIPSESNLQKDGEKHIGLTIKKSSMKNIVSKSELFSSECIPLTCKKSFSNDSMCEIQNGMLTMNSDEKKSLNFPFILGRSVSKSFNIQANIQQITSLVRMLPKESIQRTLLEEAETASRLSTKTICDKSDRGGCPACNEKTLLLEESEINLSDDPWDNTNKNFVRCTCLSKNTISSKHVLRQLLLQTTQGSMMLPSLETCSSVLEETSERKLPCEEQNNPNPLKRNDLTKLLHATQRFVTNL